MMTKTMTKSIDTFHQRIKMRRKGRDGLGRDPVRTNTQLDSTDKENRSNRLHLKITSIPQ